MAKIIKGNFGNQSTKVTDAENPIITQTDCMVNKRASQEELRRLFPNAYRFIDKLRRQEQSKRF